MICKSNHLLALYFAKKEKKKKEEEGGGKGVRRRTRRRGRKRRRRKKKRGRQKEKKEETFLWTGGWADGRKSKVVQEDPGDLKTPFSKVFIWLDKPHSETS